MIVSLMMTILMTVYDEETGFGTLLMSTKHGKDSLNRKQMLMLMSTAFLLSISSSALSFLTADLFYGISTEYAPIGSLDLFSFNSSKISILATYIIVSLIKAFGGAFLTLISLSFGRITKSSLYTAFGTVALMLLPGYIFSESKVQYLLPLPSSFFIAEGYFKTEVMGNVESAGEGFNAQMNGEAVLSIAIFAASSLAVFFGLFLWNYFRYKERRRK